MAINSQNISIVTAEDYLEIYKEKTTRNKQGRTGFDTIMGKYVRPGIEFHPKTFEKGDIIHTVAYHYMEDEYGNDINQNVIFVNPEVVTGKYRVVEPSFDEGWNCITLEEVFGHPGGTAHIGKNVILENFDFETKKRKKHGK